MGKFPESIPIRGRVRICLELFKSVRPENKTVIDVGCSFGWFEKEALKLKVGKIIGIDPSEAAIEFAKSKIKSASFQAGDARKIPLKNQFADIVVLYDIIEHVPKGDEVKALKECSRILKKDGILLFSTPNKNLFSSLCDLAWYSGHRHYSKTEVKDLLSKTGFRVEKLQVLGSIFSSLYLSWFYLAKRILRETQPRWGLMEKLDDIGYNKEGITDIFITATKI